MRMMRWERALLLALLLGSCDRNGHTISDAYDLADAAQANARNALSRIEELESRVGSGGGADMASDISRLRRRLDALEAAHESLVQTVSSNARIYNQAMGVGR